MDEALRSRKSEVTDNSPGHPPPLRRSDRALVAVAAVGVVSSAAIAHGAVGYIGQIIDLPATALIIAVTIATGCIAAIGVRDSIAFAGLLTLVEVGGLIAVVAGAAWQGNDLLGQAAASVPTSFSPVLWQGILASSLLAFFAFIGFFLIAPVAVEDDDDPAAAFIGTVFISTVFIARFVFIGTVFVARFIGTVFFAFIGTVFFAFIGTAFIAFIDDVDPASASREPLVLPLQPNVVR